MRTYELKWVIAGTLVAMNFNAVAIAEDSRPSQGVLNAMGLGGLTVITDDEALSVRGHGFKQGSLVNAFGNSFATIDTPLGTSHSENGYASDGQHIAFGKNRSEAGIELSIGGLGNGLGLAAGRAGARWGRNVGRGGLPGGGGNNGGLPRVTIKLFGGGYSVAGGF
jgi:hypothetical protein